MEHEGWTFLCGCAPYIDLIFFAAEKDELADEDITASTFCLYDGGQADADPWSMYDEIAGWRAVGMATVKPRGGSRLTLALGTHGQFFEVEPASGAENIGEITPADRLIRRVRAIDDTFFACGMGRTVLIRRARGQWEEIGPGTVPAEAGTVIGFEGIDGFSLDDIYTAGWRGEIWRRHQGVWRRIDTPTNANLNAIACAADGTVHAVGDNGVMLRGSGDAWEIIDTGRPENLMDVTTFDNTVFVVTDYRILVLTDDGLMPESRFADGDAPSTCLHLLKAEDGVVSLGPKDLFTFDGGEWVRLV